MRLRSMQIAEGTPGTLLMNLKALEAKKVPLRPHLLVDPPRNTINRAAHHLLPHRGPRFPYLQKRFLNLSRQMRKRHSQIRHLKLLRYAFHFICF
jgi:hypothetical protein